ncbi:DUF6584 family protein [Streptomyces sennicomposti]|uniref:DUF6584 family protein n=1 Tax=Streptomyces sennicomposti TaxID=2873384 RepID=UPI001CA6D1D5|nr:DUF6584 family protein [Streptomyces sennicomposti]MBY8867255.1 hypothetical protein [Streptomyces sennicomposti]
MPLRDTLARVDADLAAGRVPVARQRLRGLVSSFPDDLALRRRLAEVYRLYGDPAEAGRWMYLDEDRDAAETAAFEARYDTAPKRMRALAWQGPESLAGTAFARERLAAVRAECSEAMGRPVDWDAPPSAGAADGRGKSAFRDVLTGVRFLAVILAVVVFFAIWVNGLVALFE